MAFYQKYFVSLQTESTFAFEKERKVDKIENRAFVYVNFDNF